MHDSVSDGSVSEETGATAAAGGAVAGSAASRTSGGKRHEGDIIRGLRSGLLFSLAIWALLLTVGALAFA